MNLSLYKHLATSSERVNELVVHDFPDKKPCCSAFVRSLVLMHSNSISILDGYISIILADRHIREMGR